MKRLVLLLVLILASTALFATQLGSTSMLASGKFILDDDDYLVVTGMGIGGVAKYQYIEDFSQAYPLTYGWFANLDGSVLAESVSADEASLNLESGMALGGLVALDGELVYLTLSAGPSFYYSTTADDNDAWKEYISLGFYGDAMLFVQIFKGLGLNIGAQCYMNLIKFDAAENSNYVSTKTTYVPAIYMGFTYRDN